jgi:hypothetical protein
MDTAPNLDLTVTVEEPAGSGLPFIDTSEPPESPSPEPANTADASPAPANTADASPAPEEPAPLSGLISQEFVPPKDGAYRLHPELTHEYGAADSAASEEELEVETAAEVELQSSGASEFRVPNAAEDFMDAAGAPSMSPLPAPEFEPEILLPAVDEPEPAPYQPAAPVQASLPPVAQAPEPPVAQTPQIAEPSRTAYSARETQGQSLGSFFGNLLSARPAGAPATPPESADRREEVIPRANESAGQESTVSFDDFFGAPASGPTPNATSGADPSKDDLDQFQSWLQNLKR